MDFQNITDVLIPTVQAKLYEAYEDIEPIIKVFPPAYCYPYALERMIFFIENRHADSLKEALNLYDNEVYRDQMLSEQKKQTMLAGISAAANIVTAFNTGQIAQNTRQMVGQLSNIEANTAQTATNTAQTAANTAASAAYNKKSMEYAESISHELNRMNGGW